VTALLSPAPRTASWRSLLNRGDVDGSDDRVAALQVHGHRMVPTLRAGRGTVPSQLLYDLLLLFVGALKLFETGREWCGVNAH
jgi:hypothetical protein